MKRFDEMHLLRSALANCRTSRILVILGILAIPGGSSLAEYPVFTGPVNVIFDTDMCIDNDDGMALAMVHAFHDRHEVNLVAVTVSLDEKWCAPYVSALNTFYGHPDIPMGAIRNGLSLDLAWDRIRKGFEAMGWPSMSDVKSEDAFAQVLLKRRGSDGSPIYPHALTDRSQAPEAVLTLRKALADQPDGSVVMLQVGNSANLATLLDSQPDRLSKLNGNDLIKAKVQFLAVMAGTFQDVPLSDKSKLRKGAGVNIYEDVPSAQKVFDYWPTPIVAAGTELGLAIRIPGASIDNDFSYVPSHPIAESYRHVCETIIRVKNPNIKCPHDNHTADLTAVLYAVRPGRDYFSLSGTGKITVLPDGNMRFDEKREGTHRYLMVSEEQKIRSQEAMMLLVSQPPIKSERFLTKRWTSISSQ